MNTKKHPMMNRTMHLGWGRSLLPVPRALWQRQIRENARHMAASLGFMSAEHHRVRDYTVCELPRAARPLSPEVIASSLHLPLAQVQAILLDLERHMTFLFRNAQGDVAWASPVTVDETPHHVVLSTGERCYAV